MVDAKKMMQVLMQGKVGGYNKPSKQQIAEMGHSEFAAAKIEYRMKASSTQKSVDAMRRALNTSSVKLSKNISQVSSNVKQMAAKAVGVRLDRGSGRGL